MANQKFLIAGHKSQVLDADASTTITLTASDEMPITYYIKKLLIVMVTKDVLQDLVYVTGIIKSSDSFDGVLYTTTYIGDSLTQRAWTFPSLTGNSGSYFRPLSNHYYPFAFPHDKTGSAITMCEVYTNIRIQKGSTLELEFYLDTFAGGNQAGTEDLELSIFAEAVVA